MTIKVLGLSLYGPLAASTRHRLMQFAPGLNQQGIELNVKPLLGDSYVQKIVSGEKYLLMNFIRDYFDRAALLIRQHDYDVAIVNAELFPLLPGLIESRLLRIPFIYDFDDAFFLKYRMDRFKRISFLLRDKFKPIVSRAAAVLAGNNFLESYAKQWNPATFLLPTVVDTERYMLAPSSRDGVFTVGWIGSPTTSIYLSQLAQPLECLGLEGRVRFLVVGGFSPCIPGVDVINIPWDEATEVALINSFDVGVMPLFDDEWARGKCAFKLIQYMACGVPVVASPVGANVKVVTNTCGLLAGSAEEWINALRRLRDDPELRQSYGTAARQTIEQFYSLQSALPVMVKTIKAVIAER